MKDLNQCNFSGRIIVEPEMRYSNGGKAFTKLVVAVSDDKFNMETKEWTNKSHVIEVTFFDKTAEAIAEKFVKGDRLIIPDSKLQIDDYDDPKTGAKRRSYKWICYNMPVMTVKGERNAEAPAESNEETADEVPPWE